MPAVIGRAGRPSRQHARTSRGGRHGKRRDSGQASAADWPTSGRGRGLPGEQQRGIVATLLIPPPCSSSGGSSPTGRSATASPALAVRLGPDSCCFAASSRPVAMVTATMAAPASPFLARLSAGPEDAPRRLPASLLQRLRRADPSAEARPPGSPRPALKRVRRRRGKTRPASAGLSHSRYHHHQQHRAGLGRRVPAAEPGLEAAAPPEEAPPRPAPLSKPLRKEVRRGGDGNSRCCFPLPGGWGEGVSVTTVAWPGGGGGVPRALIG